MNQSRLLLLPLITASIANVGFLAGFIMNDQVSACIALFTLRLILCLVSYCFSISIAILTASDSDLFMPGKLWF